MLLSGVFCGLAGAYLSLGYVSLFAKQMTNERGLIALAAIFFANGNPYWTAAVALFFGTATALSVRLPQVTGAAPQLLQLIPYVVTVLALVAVGIRKTRAQPSRRVAVRALTMYSPAPFSPGAGARSEVGDARGPFVTAPKSASSPSHRAKLASRCATTRLKPNQVSQNVRKTRSPV